MNNTPPLIAIVDDDKSILKAIGRLLDAFGFRTITFDSGYTFLGSLREHLPACVLLDVHMLGLTGWDIQTEMAAAGCAIPIIFITGDGEPALIERTVSVGATLLYKPFTEQKLLKMIAAVIG